MDYSLTNYQLLHFPFRDQCELAWHMWDGILPQLKLCVIAPSIAFYKQKLSSLDLLKDKSGSTFTIPLWEIHKVTRHISYVVHMNNLKFLQVNRPLHTQMLLTCTLSFSVTL